MSLKFNIIITDSFLIYNEQIRFDLTAFDVSVIFTNFYSGKT